MTDSDLKTLEDAIAVLNDHQQWAAVTAVCLAKYQIACKRIIDDFAAGVASDIREITETQNWGGVAHAGQQAIGDCKR